MAKASAPFEIVTKLEAAHDLDEFGRSAGTSSRTRRYQRILKSIEQ